MYIGIDIGGTNIRIASFKGKKADKISVIKIFRVTKDFETSIGNIMSTIKIISKGSKIDGIGLVIAGVIDTKKKIIVKSSNLPLWEYKPLGRALESEFKTKVILENDAVAPAVCEALFGHAVKFDKFIYIIWGTGIGGSYLENDNKRLLIHCMEPGHQIINRLGVKCSCGQQGCLEAYIGGNSLSKKYGDKFYQKLSDKEWDEVCNYTAQGMLNTLLHFPVQLFVFGGGVVLNKPELLTKVSEIMKENNKIYPMPELKTLKFGDKSPLYGAVGLFFINR